MNKTASSTIAKFLRRATLAIVCSVFAVSATYGQMGSSSGSGQVPCTVNYLRLRIATGGDDLRGWDGMSSSKDNLNVTVYFGEQGSQLAANVNNNKEWANNSVHLVEIKFNQAVPLNQINGIKLEHTGSDLSIDVAKASTPAGPAGGIQTADNWDMQWVEVTAVGGGAGTLIVRHGPKRFTGSDRILSIRANIPANSCNVGERFGRLNPGTRTVENASGAGSKYGKEQLAPSTILLAPKAGAQQLQNNRLIQQALAHTVLIGPRAGVPGGDGSYSALLALLRKQSAAMHSLLLPAAPANRNQTGANSGGSTLLNGGSRVALNPQPYPPKGSAATGQTGTLLNGGTNVALNPQPYPPKGSQPQIGASQTMSAPGNGSPASTAASSTPAGNTNNFNLAPQGNSLTPTNGPTAHRPPAGRQQLPLGARAPAPLTTICRSGIATVDGAVNGVWFSPIAGEDGRFVIQGCGFGNAPGEVYLSGVQFDPAHARLMVQRLGAPNSPDRVYFQTPANSWNDRQLVVQIDANAGGLYDTNNVTLNVKTASGQVYQAIGMNFLAAREDQVIKKLVRTNYPTGTDSCYGQTLSECLVPGINLAIVNASLGPLTPQVESPTQYWLTPGESIAVVRGVIYLNTTDNYALTFPSGTDRYQFNFAPGFQLDPNKGVQLNHASMDVSHCQSLGGVYSHSGNWGVSYTSTSSFQVQWEEEACSPSSGAAKNPQGIGITNGYAGFSAYELEITVLGPRGVNPFANGNANGRAIKQLQPVQMLHKN